MTLKTKGWSKQKRAKQADNCRKNRPWKHSTGPKTDKGKEIAKDNSFKHELRSLEGKQLSELLRSQKEFIDRLK